MIVRVLAPDDVAAYRALRLRGLQEDALAFGSSHEDEVDLDFAPRLAPAPDRVNFGAFLDGDLVGVTTLLREARHKHRHKAHVVGVYVAPEARGKGAARAMLQKALETARAWRLRQVLLTVTTGNEAARALYRAHGFLTYGIEPDALCVAGKYHDEEQMVLLL